jgi:hypothetical protein
LDLHPKKESPGENLDVRRWQVDTSVQPSSLKCGPNDKSNYSPLAIQLNSDYCDYINDDANTPVEIYPPSMRLHGLIQKLSERRKRRHNMEVPSHRQE